ALYILIIVIILGAFFMVGGAQKIFISPPTDLSNHEIDTQATQNTPPNGSLQLNSIQFKTTPTP
ncbi:MAG: hypothetical protein ACHQT7_00890, partial [Candidatus Levyibacteriota bacterium]